MSWSRLAALSQSREDRRQGTAWPSRRTRTEGGSRPIRSDHRGLGSRSRQLSRARDHERRLRRRHARPARDVRAIPQRSALAAMWPPLSPTAIEDSMRMNVDEAERQRRPETTPHAPEPATDAQRDAETAQWEAWLTTRLQEEREFFLSVIGKALGGVVSQAHKDARLELSEEVRKLRIELSNLETTLNELRAVIALEKARVVDLPSPLRRVN